MLELRDIGVRFGGLNALDGVSLVVAAGEIVGLVGPNGAGKTTLFNVISGTVKPQRGTLRFDGTDISGMPAYARARRRVGRTFQIPQPMHTLTVAENVAVAQRFGTGRTDAREQAEILDLVGSHRPRDTRCGHRTFADRVEVARSSQGAGDAAQVVAAGRGAGRPRARRPSAASRSCSAKSTPGTSSPSSSSNTTSRRSARCVRVRRCSISAI